MIFQVVPKSKQKTPHRTCPVFPGWWCDQRQRFAGHGQNAQLHLGLQWNAQSSWFQSKSSNLSVGTHSKTLSSYLETLFITDVVATLGAPQPQVETTRRISFSKSQRAAWAVNTDVRPVGKIFSRWFRVHLSFTRESHMGTPTWMMAMTWPGCAVLIACRVSPLQKAGYQQFSSFSVQVCMPNL